MAGMRNVKIFENSKFTKKSREDDSNSMIVHFFSFYSHKNNLKKNVRYRL
jgi:hypothetical protein